MKICRAIVIGMSIWAFGVSVFIGSFFISLFEDPEQQANMVLLLAVLPLVLYGTKLYYRNGSAIHGFWVGLTFFIIATIMDALITVPFLVVPNGGSHQEFFLDPGFWIIGLLFIGVPSVYWYRKVRTTTEVI